MAFLTLRRLQERTGAGSGWVEVGEIATVPAWTGPRLSASLRRQVRREIQHLENEGVEIQYRTKMNGPYRLARYPSESLPDRESLRLLVGSARVSRPRTLDEVLERAAGAEPLWRGMYFFDRGGMALKDSLNAFRQTGRRAVPAARALAGLHAARCLREMGLFREALAELKRCRDFIDRNVPVGMRPLLMGSAFLEMAWVDYRGRRFEKAQVNLDEATDLAFEAGQARLLGDVMNLRGLLCRRRAEFDESLQAHFTSLEHWIVAGNFYGIQSFYHNVACWCQASAGILSGGDPRRDALLESAIQCAKDSVNISHRYDIGQNTKLSEILLANLYAQRNDFAQALMWAQAAWNGVRSTGSRYEAAMSAYVMLKLHLWRRNYAEAAAFLDAYCGDEGDSALAGQVTAAYEQMLGQVRTGRVAMPTASDLLNILE